MADHGPIEVWFSTRIGSAVYMFRTTRSPVLEPTPARAFIQVGHISLRHPIKSWRRARHAWQMVNAYVRAVERFNDPRPWWRPEATTNVGRSGTSLVDALHSEGGEQNP